MDGRVELLRRGELAAERLLDDDSRALLRAGGGELARHRLEHARWNGEVVRGALGAAQLLLELGEGRRVVVVAVDVLEERDELVERGFVETAVLGDAGAGAFDELIARPAGFGHADDGELQDA